LVISAERIRRLAASRNGEIFGPAPVWQELLGQRGAESVIDRPAQEYDARGRKRGLEVTQQVWRNASADGSVLTDRGVSRRITDGGFECGPGKRFGPGEACGQRKPRRFHQVGSAGLGCIANFPFGAGELRWVTECGDRGFPDSKHTISSCHPAVFGLVLDRSSRLGMQ